MKLTRRLALKSAVFQPSFLHVNPSFSCCLKPSLQPLNDSEFKFNRRMGLTAAITSLIVAKESIFVKVATGFDLQLVAPDQTIEEAENGIREHAEDLLQVKDLIGFESWRELQVALRKSSSYLKQDIYTIIQGKPPSERPQLRKLYSDLFNNVTRLDYAARDQDASYVRKCYENIVVVLKQILSRI